VPSPFPGMDPYLEHPGLWPSFHNRLIAALDEDLSPRLRPRYFVALEERVYIAGPPEFVGVPDAVVVPAGGLGRVATGERPAAAASNGSGVQVLIATLPVPDRVRETYLEVREALTGDVVTLIEVLSPTNKRAGEGRREYEAKRGHTLRTLTHVVEIDLLRGGEPPPMHVEGRPAGAPPPGDYRILVARSQRRPRADLYAFGVRNPIPDFPLPLLPGDDELQVELQRLVQTVYERGSYDLRLDYRAEPVPPLSAADAAWADALLRARGLR
jgi:hypothetical protein